MNLNLNPDTQGGDLHGLKLEETGLNSVELPASTPPPVLWQPPSRSATVNDVHVRFSLLKLSNSGVGQLSIA